MTKKKAAMQFRRSCDADVDRIMDILADGRASIGALGIDQWQGEYPHRDVVEGDVLRGESYLALDEEGHAMATAMIGFSGDCNYDRIEGGAWLTTSLSSAPGYVVIHRVAVAAECKGRGAASFLIEQAERMACDGQRLSTRIDTHPGNLPMRRLLAKRGYAECGTIYVAYAGSATPARVAFEKLLS